MLTIIDFAEWILAREDDDEDMTEECDACSGTGECHCCGRDCLECDGDGEIDCSPTIGALHQEYFDDVMASVARFCAYSSRHDFLDEAGEVIKTIGRPGMLHFRAHCENGSPLSSTLHR